MPSILLSDNGVSSGSAGIKTTGGSDGVLALQTTTSGGTATTAVTIDTSQNVGVGVTPSAWRTEYGTQAIQVGPVGSIFSLSASSSNNYTGYMYNSYLNSTGTPVYLDSNYASAYYQQNGVHSWSIAASGTAGNTISFTQAMTLDASGNLGVGTTSPNISGYTKSLTISSAGQTGIEIVGTRTVNGAIGDIVWKNSASSNINLGAIQVTRSAANNTGEMIFRTTNAGTDTERMRIDSSGNLLVGTTSQLDAGKLSVLGDATTYAITAKQPTVGNYVIEAWNSATSGNNSFIGFATEASVTTRGSITYNRGGGLVAYNVTSDYRSKTVNGAVQNALSKVAALKPSTGRMNGAEYDIDFFVAHELQEVVPSAVTGEKDAVKEDGTPNYQMVDKSALIPLLTAAIQEQQAIITTLTERISALEAK